MSQQQVDATGVVQQYLRTHVAHCEVERRAVLTATLKRGSQGCGGATAAAADRREAPEKQSAAPAELHFEVRKKLQLSLLNATNLRDTDGVFAGKSDPFVKVFHDGVLLHRSSTIEDKLNPVWEGWKETFTVLDIYTTHPTIGEAAASSEVPVKLEVEVWEADVGGLEECLGVGQLRLSVTESSSGSSSNLVPSAAVLGELVEDKSTSVTATHEHTLPLQHKIESGAASCGSVVFQSHWATTVRAFSAKSSDYANEGPSVAIGTAPSSSPPRRASKEDFTANAANVASEEDEEAAQTNPIISHTITANPTLLSREESVELLQSSSRSRSALLDIYEKRASRSSSPTAKKANATSADLLQPPVLIVEKADRQDTEQGEDKKISIRYIANSEKEFAALQIQSVHRRGEARDEVIRRRQSRSSSSTDGRGRQKFQVRHRFQLSLLKATNLQFSRKSNPFVKIFHDGVLLHRSSTIGEDRVNPVWNPTKETFNVIDTLKDNNHQYLVSAPLANATRVISVYIEVWEEDAAHLGSSPPEEWFLGCTSLTIALPPPAEKVVLASKTTATTARSEDEHDLPLETRDGLPVGRGFIHLSSKAVTVVRAQLPEGTFAELEVEDDHSEEPSQKVEEPAKQPQQTSHRRPADEKLEKKERKRKERNLKSPKQSEVDPYEGLRDPRGHALPRYLQSNTLLGGQNTTTASKEESPFPHPSATAVLLPPLEGKYLKSHPKYDAQRDQSRRRKEASEVKFRLQRMFRDLDRVDAAHQSRQARGEEEGRTPKPITNKERRRWAGKIEKLRVEMRRGLQGSELPGPFRRITPPRRRLAEGPQYGATTPTGLKLPKLK